MRRIDGSRRGRCGENGTIYRTAGGINLLLGPSRTPRNTARNRTKRDNPREG